MEISNFIFTYSNFNLNKIFKMKWFLKILCQKTGVIEESATENI